MAPASSTSAPKVQVQLSPAAYIKIILHCGKYPSANLLGLLVGRQLQQQQGQGELGINTLLIEDIVPLSHHWSALSPMAEVGCALTEAHLASTSAGSSSILGCYEAPAKLREDKPSAPCLRLAQRIAQRSSSSSASSSNAATAALAGRALVVVLNNQLLLSPTSDPFIASIHSSSSSSSSGGDSPGAQAQLPKGSITIAGADAAQAFSDASVVAAKLLQEGVAGRIADLDDHLINPSLDWLQNKRLQTAIPRVA